MLHIVTSLSEYQTGDRDTVKGSDRLQEVMIPILVDSVSTMILPPYNYQVDVYLILAWSLKPERRRVIEDALPESAGLDIWDNENAFGIYFFGAYKSNGNWQGFGLTASVCDDGQA